MCQHWRFVHIIVKGIDHRVESSYIDWHIFSCQWTFLYSLTSILSSQGVSPLDWWVTLKLWVRRKNVCTWTSMWRIRIRMHLHTTKNVGFLLFENMIERLLACSSDDKYHWSSKHSLILVFNNHDCSMDWKGFFEFAVGYQTYQRVEKYYSNADAFDMRKSLRKFADIENLLGMNFLFGWLSQCSICWGFRLISYWYWQRWMWRTPRWDPEIEGGSLLSFKNKLHWGQESRLCTSLKKIRMVEEGRGGGRGEVFVHTEVSILT